LKYLSALALVLTLFFSAILRVSAQAAETIWLESNKESYSAGETITVTLKANTVTPIQGFSFQLRYDSACLQSAVPSSLLPGLIYQPVPQTAGLVEAVFTSPSPLSAKGALVEVKFKSLSSCQTSLKLEKASLSVADSSGKTVPLPGISPGISSLVLNLGGAEAAAPQPTRTPETHLTSLPQSTAPATPEIKSTPTRTSTSGLLFSWLLVWLEILLGLFLFVRLAMTFISIARQQRPTEATPAPLPPTPALIFKRGPQAGTILRVEHFPCRIGSDPKNEVCLNDPKISPIQAEILGDEYGYTLVDLGGEFGTYINGKLINNQQVQLNPGDTLRLGGILLIFSQVQ
jgi:hypothetical protein